MYINAQVFSLDLLAYYRFWYTFDTGYNVNTCELCHVSTYVYKSNDYWSQQYLEVNQFLWWQLYVMSAVNLYKIRSD